MGLAQCYHLGKYPRPSPQSALRALQFIFAIIVAGLYGVDLHNATSSHLRAPTPWVYAEVVACLSILTCAVHTFSMVKHAAWGIWDFVLFILWVALFGVFGSIYIGGRNTNFENATSSLSRMKAAVWIDLVNMILWLASIVQGIAWCCVKGRKTRQTDERLGDEERREEEYRAGERWETHSSGEVEAEDLKGMRKEDVLCGERQTKTFSNESTLADSKSGLKGFSRNFIELDQSDI